MGIAIELFRVCHMCVLVGWLAALCLFLKIIDKTSIRCEQYYTPYASFWLTQSITFLIWRAMAVKCSASYLQVTRRTDESTVVYLRYTYPSKKQTPPPHRPKVFGDERLVGFP